MKRFILSIILLIACFGNSYAIRFVVYGDTRTNAPDHRVILNQINGEEPDLILNTGDVWQYNWDYTPEKDPGQIFYNILSENPNVFELLKNNKYLISRGNHEDRDSVLIWENKFKYTLRRNNEFVYSFTQGNCFFICLEYQPWEHLEYLEEQLKSKAAEDAQFIIVFAHAVIYSSGAGYTTDGWESSGKKSVINLFDKYGVDLYFNGHEHNYERTHLMYQGIAVSKSNIINPKDQGTVYVVAGGGGVTLRDFTGVYHYSNTRLKTHSYCMLSTSSNQLVMDVKDSMGNPIDQLIINKGIVGPDTTIPTLSNLEPSGKVISKMPKLSANTDEKAFLRWSNIDQDYDDMPNQFEEGEGTFMHATPVEGLIDGQSYTFYVRAKDEAGNASSESGIIEFTLEIPNDVLVEDCEDGDGTNLKGGYWYTLTDSGSGGESVITPVTSNTVSFKMSENDGFNSKYGAHIDYTLHKGTLTWNPYVEATMTFAQSSSIDLTNTIGLTFNYMGSGCDVILQTAAVNSNGDFAYHRASIESAIDWTEKEILWSEFCQPTDWGDILKVDLDTALEISTALSWSISGEDGDNGSLSLDNIKLIGSVENYPDMETKIIDQIHDGKTMSPMIKISNTNKVIQLDISEVQGKQSLNLSIYNMRGQEIYRMNRDYLFGKTLLIPFNKFDFPIGQYIVKIKIGNIKLTEKFFLMK